MKDALSSTLARGIRWRLTGSLLVVITAAIAVGTAVVGPLFLRAGGDSLVRQAVAAASERRTRFELTPITRSTTLDGLAAKQRSLLASEHLSGHYGPLVVKTKLSTVLVTSTTHEVWAGQLAYRSGICSVLHFSSGGCRAGPLDAVISERSAHALGVGVGSTLPATDRKGTDPVGIHITGVFRVADLQSPYWFGEPQTTFLFGQNTEKPLELDQVDDLFVASPAALALPSAYTRSYAVQTGLRVGTLGIANASSVIRQLDALKRRASLNGYEAESGLATLLAEPLHQQSLMNTIVVVAAVQLVLLAIWVLTSALMRSADLRRSELRVARLRGFPLPTLLAVSVTEPAALCAIGVVLGILGAWGVVLIASSILFTSGTSVGIDGWTIVGFAAVVLTICVVLGLSSLRLIRSVGLAATAPQSTGSRARVVTDVSILVLSVLALVGAATSGALSSHTNPVAAAAPAFVALGTSVIAIRAVEYLCRRLSARTLDSSAVALFLAVRQVGRRPTALREGRTLIIAVALACFAVSAWSVARANRVTASTFSVGADMVVTVKANDHQLAQAVQELDPHGRFAMAAIQVSGAGTPVVALDASRLARVAAWPTGTTRQSVATVGHALMPRRGPEADLRTGALEVSASVSGSGAAARDLSRLHLTAWLFDSVDGIFTVNLGSLHAGESTYEGPSQPNCPCRLVGMGVLPGDGHLPSSGRIHLGLTALGYDSVGGASRSGSAGLLARSWRSGRSEIDVSANASEVGIEFPIQAVIADNGYGSSAMASLGGQPAVLPAVAGGFAAVLAVNGGQYGTLPVQGLDGNNVSVRPALQAASLPRIGRGGVVVDLGAIERTQTGPTSSDITTAEVWLGTSAPSNAVSRLRAAGLHVEGVERSATLIRQAAHTGPALAYDFMLLATLVALLVAAVGTFSVLAASGRQRATEMVALEVTGVRRSSLARSLSIEAGILALTALFGVAAGAGSAAIALPSLPQLATSTDAPLSYALPVLLLLAAAAGAVVVVTAATALAARGILSSMSPSLLRNAADDVD